MTLPRLLRAADSIVPRVILLEAATCMRHQSLKRRSELLSCSTPAFVEAVAVSVRYFDRLCALASVRSSQPVC